MIHRGANGNEIMNPAGDSTSAQSLEKGANCGGSPITGFYSIFDDDYK